MIASSDGLEDNKKSNNNSDDYSNHLYMDGISSEISFSDYPQRCCVCFVDMVDSTEIIAQISDPVRIRKYYSTFINTVAAIAKGFGAKVIKNTGDCLIYYFPKTLEHCNTSAFRDVIECGLATIAASTLINTELSKDRLPPIKYRISADFGTVEIARSSSQTNDLFGTTISLCAKMNSMAYPNGMVIGRNLYDIIKKYYFGDYNYEEVYSNYVIDGKEKYHVYAVKSRVGNIADLARNNELSELDLKRSNVFSANKKRTPLSINQKQSKVSSRNILIVDDEPDALFTYKTFLASEGFNVDAFTVPEEALKIFATRNASHYSLLIVDIRMPRLNGLQLYHRLRAMSMSAKVLFVSALDAAAELISILPDSSDMRVIKKPADQEHFMAAVKALLGSGDER